MLSFKDNSRGLDEISFINEIKIKEEITEDMFGASTYSEQEHAIRSERGESNQYDECSIDIKEEVLQSSILNPMPIKQEYATEDEKIKGNSQPSDNEPERMWFTKVPSTLCTDKISLKNNNTKYAVPKAVQIYNHQRVLQKVAHNNNWKCRECNIEFMKRSAFTKHLKNVHPIMVGHYDGSNIILFYDAIMTSPDKNLYKCRKCPTSSSGGFANYLTLERHVRSKHNSLIYRCLLCVIDFSYKENLSRHINVKHQQELPENHIEKENVKVQSICYNDSYAKYEDSEQEHTMQIEREDFNQYDECSLGIKEEVLESTIANPTTENVEMKGNSQSLDNELDEMGLTKVPSALCTDKTSLKHTNTKDSLSKAVQNLKRQRVTKKVAPNNPANNNWKCRDCNKEFTKRFAFSQHLKNVHPIIVGHYNGSNIKLFYDAIMTNADNNLYKCLKCPASKSEGFSNYMTLERHVRSEHNSLIYQCLVCVMDFTYKENLSRHIKANHQGDMRDKPIEKEKYKVKSIFYNDSYTKCEDYFLCLLCKCKFMNVAAVMRHIRSDHFRLIYFCPKCPNKKEYMEKQNLKKHLKDKHQLSIALFKNQDICMRLGPKSDDNDDADKISSYSQTINQSFKKVANYFVCTICTNSTIFQYRESVKRHVRNEHFALKYSCTQCDSEYNDKLNLSQHLRLQHQINIEDLNANDIIKKQTDNEKESDNECGERRKNYSGSYQKIDNYFICLICGMENSANFSCRGLVACHIRNVHYGLRYKCTECGKLYLEKQSLKYHLKLKHQMSIKTFKRKDIAIYLEALNEGGCLSNRTNTINDDVKCGRRPRFQKFQLRKKFYKKTDDDFYICLKCTSSTKFHSKRMLTMHMKAEHYGHLHKCALCQKEYKHKENLNHHLYKAHQFNNMESSSEQRFIANRFEVHDFNDSSAEYRLENVNNVAKMDNKVDSNIFEMIIKEERKLQ